MLCTGQSSKFCQCAVIFGRRDATLVHGHMPFDASFDAKNGLVHIQHRSRVVHTGKVHTLVRTQSRSSCVLVYAKVCPLGMLELFSS